MANNEASKMITLRSFDGECFLVSEVVALMSQSIRHIIEDNGIEGIIPVPNVDAKVLSMVIEYCKKHVIGEATIAADDSNPNISEEELKKWDEDFIDIDMDRLYEIIMAANFLDINELLNLACQKVANMIKGKSPEEIRRIFNIENDFTPEGEEEIRRENQWAFE